MILIPVSYRDSRVRPVRRHLRLRRHLALRSGSALHTRTGPQRGMEPGLSSLELDTDESLLLLQVNDVNLYDQTNSYRRGGSMQHSARDTRTYAPPRGPTTQSPPCERRGGTFATLGSKISNHNRSKACAHAMDLEPAPLHWASTVTRRSSTS